MKKLTGILCHLVFTTWKSQGQQETITPKLIVFTHDMKTESLNELFESDIIMAITWDPLFKHGLTWSQRG